MSPLKYRLGQASGVSLAAAAIAIAGPPAAYLALSLIGLYVLLIVVLACVSAFSPEGKRAEAQRTLAMLLDREHVPDLQARQSGTNAKADPVGPTTS
jgi:hypothetical protein